jgi:hypothetical protein
MKFKILLATLALSALQDIVASERLAISPAYALPDYDKSTAVTGTTNRVFFVAFTAGDFNKDGRTDLAIETAEPHPYPDIYPLGVKIFLQNASGGFEEKAEYLLPGLGITWQFNTGDFNEDGHLDILMEASEGDMLLMTGKGDGGFSEPTRLGLAAAGYFATADLDGDTHLDLVAGLVAEGTVGVFKGSGNGNFDRRTILDTPISASMSRRGEINLGDINRDGKIDVAVGSWPQIGDGNLDVFLGNGDGTFGPVVQTLNVAARRGVLADFNGDGFLDYAGLRRTDPEQLEIWLGKGDGTFKKGKQYPAGLYTYAGGLAVGDVNQDGILDLAVSGQINDTTTYVGPINIFLGNGDGSFQPRIEFRHAQNRLTIQNELRLMDFNADGYLDILSLCWTTSTVGNPEAVMIAIGKGPKLDLSRGSRLTVNRENAAQTSPLRLERSSDFQTWIGVATNTATSGQWLFNDTTPGLGPKFYRTQRP